MREDTIFRIASMTKPITSVAVLMLHEEGRFQLDAPIARFIPEFEHPEIVVRSTNDPREFERVPAQREITIRHLLTHTSGISYGFSDVPPLTRLYAEAEVSDGLVQTEGTIGQGIRRLAKQPLLHEPGTAWKYGLSTDVLGRLVEVVSGKTLAKFFEEDIFAPLGMKDTHFFLPEEKVSRLASVYRLRDGNLRELPVEPIEEGPVVFSASYHYQGPRTYFSGGAGLVSTVDDYYRFCQMLLNGGELDGARLLEPETVREMTTNQIGELSVGDGKFGFGFSIETKDTVGAFGWGGFFFTSFWIDPESEAIGIFMAQLWPNQRARVDDDFRSAVNRAIR
jgi:CubicO group peptidase (beta-lactamase class C family)